MNHQQNHDAALQTLEQFQACVFFNKLASLGIQPNNQDEAMMLWNAGNELVSTHPRLSDQGQQIKQASAQVFGENSSPVAADGFTLQAHRIVDECLKDPDQRILKAAHFVLSVQNN